jgi:hypothetical protein
MMYLDDYSRLALGRERMEQLQQEAGRAGRAGLAEALASGEQEKRRSRLALRQALRRAEKLAQARAR